MRNSPLRAFVNDDKKKNTESGEGYKPNSKTRKNNGYRIK